jgi:hypothetical protein
MRRSVFEMSKEVVGVMLYETVVVTVTPACPVIT